jgi:hypothetical protein
MSDNSLPSLPVSIKILFVRKPVEEAFLKVIVQIAGATIVAWELSVFVEPKICIEQAPEGLPTSLFNRNG